MADLNDFAGGDEIVIEIKNDNPKKANEDIGLRISILNPESEKLNALRRKHADDNVRTFLENPKASVSEVTEAQQLELVAEAIVGWEWHSGATFGGQALAFNKENVMKVLKEAKHKFVYSQVLRAFTDKSRFF